jgi:hypothetical protein
VRTMKFDKVVTLVAGALVVSAVLVVLHTATGHSSSAVSASSGWCGPSTT